MKTYQFVVLLVVMLAGVLGLYSIEIPSSDEVVDEVVAAIEESTRKNCFSIFLANISALSSEDRLELRSYCSSLSL